MAERHSEEDMNISEFLELDEDVRNELIKVHRTQKRIREALIEIKEERKRLRTHELNLQLECTHPSAVSQHLCEEDEYGSRISGAEYIDYKCPDCGKRWQENA